jgi:heme-degrading monooxygenase HmoA
MFKPLLGWSKSWFLAGLLLLSLWLMLTQPAQAGKSGKALTFGGSGSSVEVVAIYETSYAAQKSVVKALKIPTKLMKKAAGFQGSSMLQSQDGKQVIAFSQWQDLASYQAYEPSSPATSSAPTSTSPGPAQTLLFERVTAQTSIPGATPALRGKEAVVHLVQFTPKDAEARSQVQSYVEAMILKLLKQQPIPQSVLLLKGIDHDTIALMLNWNCSALFEDVGKPGAIALSSELTTIADYTQQLYNVVNIIPVEVKKPADKDD